MQSRTEIRVLLVEDNATDVLQLKEAFADVEDTKFVLIHVERLADAKALLAKDRFDVILLDLGLPDSQGIETFIKLHQDASDIPVLVFTALADEKCGIRVLEEGAQDYLLKRELRTSSEIRGRGSL